ncbi:serine protease [Irineochytrium annulatum]|nr:serine protease [Irineochytrium annulatum]
MDDEGGQPVVVADLDMDVESGVSNRARPPFYFNHRDQPTMTMSTATRFQDAQPPPPDQLGSLFAHNLSSSSRWEQTLNRIIPAIVSIRLISVRNFGEARSVELTLEMCRGLVDVGRSMWATGAWIDTDHMGASQASGFIVDKTRGIILSNRHVVHPGPILAEGIFSESKEEIKLVPIYRDPGEHGARVSLTSVFDGWTDAGILTVHDFGFFKFEVSEIKYMKLVEIPLNPEKARIGIDIRVVGNDSGERLSILSGTLARMDRRAPQYGVGKYNGGATSSASSFFLPLDRVVRVLRLIQEGVPIPRGTLQTVFKYSPFDEVKRLGLKPDVEATLRKDFPENTGMLVVSQVIPKGPADDILESGDILVRAEGNFLLKFADLEEILDSNVGGKVKLELQRGTELKEVAIPIQDLHSISPDRYVEIGGAILNTLSYQIARSFMVPVGGVYVAGSGYMLGLAGVSRKCLITSLNNMPTPTLELFIEAVNTLRDGERVPIRYYHLADINKEKLALVPVDRKWHSFRMAARDDTSGVWHYKSMPPCIGPAIITPHTATPISLDESLGPGRVVIPSLVHVEFHLPFKVDGVIYQDHSGIGLVVDAARGLVVCDRHTIPTFIGDVLLTFANSIFIPGKILYIHQIYNFAVLQYDPFLLGETPVTSATLSDKVLLQGDSVHLVCLSKSYQPLARKTIVTNVRQFYVAEPIPPSYRATNVEGIELENPISHGGVLCDEQGRVQALYAAHTKHSPKGRNEFYIGLHIHLIRPILERLDRALNKLNAEDGTTTTVYDARPVVEDVRGLEVEMTYAQVAHVRLLGLTDEWVRKIEEGHKSRRNVLLVRRLTSGTEVSKLLKEGDVLLAVNGVPATTFDEVLKHVDLPELELTILRDKKEMTVTVPQSVLQTSGTSRIVGWSGAIFQMPSKAVYQQLKQVPEGVLCSVVHDGSPAQLYQLHPLSWVTEINEHKIRNLDDFIAAVSKIPSDTFARIRTVNYNRFVRVIAIRCNSHYFGTWEISYNGGWKLTTL